MVPMNRREFSQAAVSSAGVALLGRPGVPAEERMGAVLTLDGSITDVPGVRVGHFTDSRRPTGCTAIIFDGEAAAGVDYDGSAPGSYLGVLLQPVSPVETIHGMLLTGEGRWGSPLSRARFGILRSARQDLTGGSRMSAYRSWSVP